MMVPKSFRVGSSPTFLKIFLAAGGVLIFHKIGLPRKEKCTSFLPQVIYASWQENRFGFPSFLSLKKLGLISLLDQKSRSKQFQTSYVDVCLKGRGAYQLGTPVCKTGLRKKRYWCNSNRPYHKKILGFILFSHLLTKEK